MFVDIAKIQVKAGNGGDGHVSFRREKNIAKGGPDGGDGGNGGNVVLLADNNLATLMDFRTRPFYEAQKGQPGGKKHMNGAAGEDLEIKVPVGTLVYEIREDEEILVGDLNTFGSKLLIAVGGSGGIGNSRFKSSTNQAPRQFIPGGDGEFKTLKLEIKLLADVGLIGLPNAGKSTLINQLTRAHAQVGSYPFTTLVPNLGVCVLADGQEIIIADIPGLIEGASQGKGLGDAFLRHVERTRILVHVIDGFSLEGDFVSMALSSYETIRNELAAYSSRLSEKREIVVLNKLDITEVQENFELISKAFKDRGVDILGISGVTGEGMVGLKQAMLNGLWEVPEVASFDVVTPTKVVTIDTLPNRRLVFGNRIVKNKP